MDAIIIFSVEEGKLASDSPTMPIVSIRESHGGGHPPKSEFSLILPDSDPCTALAGFQTCHINELGMNFYIAVEVSFLQNGGALSTNQ